MSDIDDLTAVIAATIRGLTDDSNLERVVKNALVIARCTGAEEAGMAIIDGHEQTTLGYIVGDRERNANQLRNVTIGSIWKIVTKVCGERQ